MRSLTNSEIYALVAAGNSAESWQSVVVADGFNLAAVQGCHFEGRVEIEAGVTLRQSTICNYHICSGAKVESTTRMECRHRSAFGNGVKVATVNENGGRTVLIYNGLTAQTAYIAAMYRHRKGVVEAIESQIAAYAERCSSDMGVVGRNTTIVGARFIREVNFGEGVTVEGASLLENGTVLDGAYIGIDVKAADFIAVEGSKIDFGAILERVFIGENVIVSNGFTAVDSLLFASSHLENGEACAVFAGPYTVSHHKSSLLIAGIFSFFNAGSGTNQSNHLFKSGAVHQAVHRRGCKFGSNGYVMAPADEGEFTVVIGRHTKHHNTALMPFSYLIENGGVSYLVPAFALRSYGTVRDIEKWQQRDKRRVCRDIISYNEYNPLLTGKVVCAVDILERELQSASEELHYNNTVIKRRMAERGVALYNKYITAALGSMLSTGAVEATNCKAWVDVAGQYVDREYLEHLLDNFSTIETLEEELKRFATNYDKAAYGWALSLLASRLGKTPTAEDVAAAVEAGKLAHDQLRSTTDADREADTSLAMSIGYGIDSQDAEIITADFRMVQKL